MNDNDAAMNISRGFQMNKEAFFIEETLKLERERLYKEARERIYGKEESKNSD